ncbi:uncharacterized protein LOC132203931 [Neocloeon triangulifer]|uniref:uncharacterized protein LOC132203931 n=1 Tax=Neocloeon triangulifer TaxID=2078957 RepID=UPI00286EBC5B|nr:uncharacterized protein LOC132203931 [Neocloeon triangulifer]
MLRLKLAVAVCLVSLAAIDRAAGQNFGQGEWRSGANGGVPPGAFVGGHDNGQPVYVARASFRGGLLPGKLVSRLGQAYVPFFNKEYKVQNYDVLVGSNYKWDTWANTKDYYWPNSAVVGGYSAQQKDTLYVCRVNAGNNKESIGKVHLRHKKCFYPHNGKEYDTSYFDLLLKL